MKTVKDIERLARRQGQVVTIREQDTAATAARRMTDSDVGALVVLDSNSRASGIVSERDIIKKVVGQTGNPARTSVADIMSTRIISCTLDTTITRAQRLMTAHNIRHLPIIEDDVPVGMLSSRDLLAFQLTRTKAVARRQSVLLDHIEREHPELARWRYDGTGRIIID